MADYRTQLGRSESNLPTIATESGWNQDQILSETKQLDKFVLIGHYLILIWLRPNLYGNLLWSDNKSRSQYISPIENPIKQKQQGSLCVLNKQLWWIFQPIRSTIPNSNSIPELTKQTKTTTSITSNSISINSTYNSMKSKQPKLLFFQLMQLVHLIIQQDTQHS